MVALCVVVYVPVTGAIAGVAATGRLMVMTDVATVLLEKPAPPAIAFTVVVALTLNEPVYSVELTVGTVPSFV
jgi:hypothetical protein